MLPDNILHFMNLYDKINMVIKMEREILKYGNHIINNDYDGYLYSYNFSDGYDFNSHLHKCFEFIHIIEGRLIYTVEGNDYMLTEGDIIMTKPNELHSFSFPEKQEYKREFLHVYPGFVDKFPDLVKPLISREDGYFNRIPAAVAKKYGIYEIFERMDKCCRAREAETDYIMLAHTIELMSVICQILRKEAPEAQEIVTNKKTNAIYDYVEKHYQDDITIEKIARSLYVSPSYLSRVFKKETGMTIKNYINMRRVTKAKNLIVEGRRITDVYLECGFSDYTTFYRAFIKYAGTSPDDFKKTNKFKIV